MPVTHINRKRDTYYLHVGKTKDGETRYWFSKVIEGDLVKSMPEGFEVYENHDAHVFLRKIVPQLVTPVEVAMVKDGLKRYATGQDCIVDVKGEHIVVSHAERVAFDPQGFALPFPVSSRNYMKMLRFTLVGEEERTFRVQRWCFRGSIGDWIDLWASGSEGKLSDLVKKFCPHIGQESFYELM
jgi:hypothetical protein